MRAEKAIMTSRREFLSNALGTALVTASTSPIRTDQTRSTHGRSDSSTANSGRTTQNRLVSQKCDYTGSRGKSPKPCQMALM